MVEAIYKVYLHEPVTELEYEALVLSAGDHGIYEVEVTESARIILAEFEEEEEGQIKEVIKWLARSLYTIEDIAGIEQSKWYYPEAQGESDSGSLEVIVRFDD